MARKQFVSSKKNAPSRAVSSKEAALRSRDPDNVGDEDDEDVASDADDASMNGGGDSPMSSVASSVISSDDDGGDEDADDDNDKEDPADNGDDDDAAAVAVQVMPASVGRGKQLRFPTAISRGKEARILHNGSDRDNSDSESYASVASDDEEEPDDDMHGASQEAPVAVTQDAAASPSRSPAEEEEVTYPIKAIRARKRHRPDSGYFAQMSTHVRDCLLSIRDVGTAEALSEDAHREFRRKLSAGTVERVPWKQVSPPPPAVAPSESEKKVPKSSSGHETEKRHTAKEDKESKSSKSSSRKNGEDRSERRSEKSSRGDGDSSESRKKDRSGKENDSRGSRRDEKDSKRSSDKKDSSERSKSSHSKSSSSKRAEVNGNGVVRPESDDPLCAKCKKSVKEQNADEEKRKAAVEASAAAAALQAKAAQAQLEAAEAAKAQAQAAQIQAAPTVTPVPVGTFIVPTNSNRDIAQMREEAARLNDEARSLKHEGNRHGTADPGPDGQAAQGRFYLRSSAKFFQHALLLADIKAAYREAGDERHARTYGDFSVQTLAQTSSLIESTVRKLRSAGNRRLVALGYKLASIVELTIYRLQHVKLFSLYSDLYTPGRSPDTRQNGTTPPINGAASDSQDSAVKALLLKEMEHTLRGFDMWQRYEACRIDVLPRVTNPAVVDLPALFEDLRSELGQS